MTKIKTSPEINDYLNQHKILSEALDKTMDCVIIFPAASALQNAIADVVDAIKWQALYDLGIKDVIEDTASKWNVDVYGKMNDDFIEWKKTGGGKK